MSKQNTQLFRQPIHTVYGGAHLFSFDVAHKLGNIALKSFATNAKNGQNLAIALGENYGDGKLWNAIYDRVSEKLKTEAIEDYRLDFEDGYGPRPDDEEDHHAQEKAVELARGMKEKTLSPFIGIRVKSFHAETLKRSKRTLDLFLTTLLKNAGKKLPENFVITLPKVENKKQAIAFEKFLTSLETKLKLKKGILKCELMVETAPAVLTIRSMVEAMKGRCRGVHFGTYDYTASLNIIASFQTMDNPVCDFAKLMMQVNLAELPVFLSDGATTLMPIGDNQKVFEAWQLSYKNIFSSLRTGFYQGWDLHPAQIPLRYVAHYAVFLGAFESNQARLKSFLEKSAKANLVGNHFDDAATGQGLLNYFLRGYYSGALTKAEVLSSGLTLEQLETRSFRKILG